MLNAEIIIADDGVGLFKEKGEADPERQHFGIALTKERFKLLSDLSGQKYTIEQQELVDDMGVVRGTQIKLTLPAIPVEIRLVDTK